jgi:hypothetical protein
MISNVPSRRIALGLAPSSEDEGDGGASAAAAAAAARERLFDIFGSVIFLLTGARIGSHPTQ